MVTEPSVASITLRRKTNGDCTCYKNKMTESVNKERQSFVVFISVLLNVVCAKIEVSLNFSIRLMFSCILS